MIENDPLEPRIIVPDTAFVPPTRTSRRFTAGNPIRADVAVGLLLILAATVGLGTLLDVIFGDSARPIGPLVATSLAACHLLFWPRHRWWALLAALIGFVGGVTLFDGFLAGAYASDCATALAIVAYVLVTHLPGSTDGRRWTNRT